MQHACLFYLYYMQTDCQVYTYTIQTRPYSDYSLGSIVLLVKRIHATLIDTSCLLVLFLHE